MREKVGSGIDWSEGVPFGRYVIHDRIASGGTASVHLARLGGAGGFSRVVAIKKLHEHVASDPKFVIMLLDEARLVASLRHPNVVPTLEIVEEGESIALVMEYVAGLPLSDIVKLLAARNEPIPTATAITIAAHVLHGLDAAHEAVDASGRKLHIVHRDVSPQNVLVGTDGLARIVDFGIAQASHRLQTTQAGEVKGKVAYMAPEQLNGDAVDRRSDIFAVGVVLWEMLTSQRLFYERSEGQTVSNVLHKKVAPPVSAGFASSALNQIVLRALERDPDRRYASCADMADALEDTMSLVKPRELGAWVERTESPQLAERKAMVRRIEAQAAACPPPPSTRISRFLAAAAAEQPLRVEVPPRVEPARVEVPPRVEPPPPEPEPVTAPPPPLADTVRPKIRKVRSSIDSAITHVRVGSKREIDEIRKLYEAGEIATALVRAETVRVEEQLTLTSVPQVNVSPGELLGLPLDHRAGFMLTRVDGASDVEAILNVAGMPETEAFELLEKLLTIGVLSITGDTAPHEGDDATLPPRAR